MNSSGNLFKKVPPVQLEEYDPLRPSLVLSQQLVQQPVGLEDPSSYYHQSLDSSVTTDIDSSLWYVADHVEPVVTQLYPNALYGMSGVNQSAAAPATPTFARPSPVRPAAPVKQMRTPPSAGKRITMDRSTKYDSTDGRHSASDDSSAEEEQAVESPVGGVVRRPSTPAVERGRREERSGGGKRSRSPSSSSSSASSRADRSPEPHKRRHKKKKTKKDRRSEKNTRDVVADQRSDRSRSRSRSVHGGGPRVAVDEPTTTVRTGRTAPEGGVVSTAIDEPADEVIEVNRRVYQKIRNDGLVRPSAATDDNDAASSVTSRRGSIVRANNRTPGGAGRFTLVQLVQNCLKEDLRTDPLAVRSVHLLWDNANASRMKQKQLVDAVRNMYRVPSAATDQVEPRLRTDSHLFCTYNDTFGYDQEALEKNAGHAARTLSRALHFDCNRDDDSLDMVFRQALKELADELYAIGAEGDASLDNPLCISGQYLELRLLQKIRNHYRTRLDGKDIATYLTQSSRDTQSPFHRLVDNNAAEEYVRTLYDRYRLRPDTFDDVLRTVSFVPTMMRVWTDVDTQFATNTALTNYLKKVYDDRRYTIYDGGVTEIIDTYAAAMKACVAANRDFLAETCRASELFAWMCLGVVTDDHEEGTMHMALSYHFIKKERTTAKKNKLMCWNYPLASMYERDRPPPAEKRKAKRAFIEGVQKVFSKEVDDHL